MEHLAAVAGDHTTRSLAKRCRRELEPLAERWSASWDTVLELEAEGANGDAYHAMVELLEEAHDMEAMRASLLAVTAAQARAAGNAPGAEDAGLGRLVALMLGARVVAAGRGSRPFRGRYVHRRARAAGGRADRGASAASWGDLTSTSI